MLMKKVTGDARGEGSRKDSLWDLGAGAIMALGVPSRNVS